MPESQIPPSPPFDKGGLRGFNAPLARWLWLSLLVLLSDQASKWLIHANLQPFESIVLTENIRFTLMFNTGAAFSFLADAGGWQRWLFALVALSVSIGLTVWLLRLRAHERGLAIGLALLIGGALGNLIDRVLFGHVIDFIQVSLPFIPLALFNPWPAFNIADSAITLGVTILLILSLFDGEQTQSG